MNALDRRIVNVRKRRAAARLAGCLAGAGLLSGCLGDPIASARIDPNSPIAGEVAAVTKANKGYPSFKDIPAKPKDVQRPRVYAERARDLKADRAALEAATAPNTWTLHNTAGFTDKARSAVSGGPTAPTGSDTEAFANSVRKRATPPPQAGQ